MKHHLGIALPALLLVAGCAYRLNEVDPNPQLARETHGAFLRSEKGFGLDPTKANYFYDSFEDTQPGMPPTGKWIAVQSGSNSVGDRWKASAAQSNFGSRSLTYGESDVILKELDFGKVTLTTKDAISFQDTSDPRLVLFAGFLQTGQSNDQTALRVEVTSDLGFTWTTLMPTGTDSATIAQPVKKPGEGPIWARHLYNLAPYKGQSVRLRLTLSASANSRKLPFLDDILVVDTK